MHSSPAAFPTTLCLPFSPFTLHRLAPTHLVAPQAAPSSIYSQRPSLSLQTRYDAASTKNAAARPAGSYSLVASAALSPRPSDPCVDPCTMTLVRHPAFQQVAGDLNHATALDTGLLLLPFKLRPPIHHTSSRLSMWSAKAASAR
jgi:hypothetical protein